MSRVFAYAPVKIYFCIGDSQSVESAVLGNGGDSMYKSSILSLGFSPFTPHSNMN
jgi:hypothetical protein